MAEPHQSRAVPGTDDSPKVLRALRRWCALFLAALLVAGPLSVPFAVRAEAAEASQETLNKLSDAQKQLDEVNKKIEEIGRQYEALAKEQTQTLDQIGAVQSDISDVEDQIETKQGELHDKQDVLADRVSTNYKTGTSRNLLSLILSSSSFEELTSNIYYANKVTETDVQLINDVRTVKRELEEDRLELKDKESQLEALRDEQQNRLDEMQAKQEESEAAVANLSQEVKDLMDQRDKEVAEAIAAEARQREEQARNAAANPGGSSSGGSVSSSSGSSGGSSSSGGGYTPSGTPSQSASGKGASIVAACSGTPSPGAGLCAMWVSQVYLNALGYYPGGNANDMYSRLSSTNLNDLQPGMAIAVSTHPHTSAGRIYGHVGIYIGNGLVMDNVGYVRTIGLNEWIDFYNDTVPVRWGWL